MASSSNRLIYAMNNHTDGVKTVAISPDGKKIISGGYDKYFRIWNTDSGELITSIEHPYFCREITSIVFSPCGTKFAVSSASIDIYDTFTTNIIIEYNLDTCWIYSIAFSADGRKIVAGEYDGDILLLDASESKIIMKILGYHHLKRRHLDIDIDVDPFSHVDGVRAVAFSPDGTQIVSGGKDGTVRLWNSETGELIQILYKHSNEVASVAFSSNGEMIASGGYDNAIHIYDISINQLRHKIIKDLVKVQYYRRNKYVKYNAVKCVVFSPDNKTIMTGSYDNAIRQWNVITGELMHTMTDHTDVVSSIAYSKDGNILVSGSYDYTVHMRLLNSGKKTKPVSYYDKYSK